MRERFFTPRLRVTSYEELNAWLLDRCIAYAKGHRQLVPLRSRRYVQSGLGGSDGYANTAMPVTSAQV